MTVSAEVVPLSASLAPGVHSEAQMQSLRTLGHGHFVAGISGLGQIAARSWSMGWVFSPRQLVWGLESRPIGGWVISVASEAGRPLH